MLRLFVYLLLLAGAATGLAWLADRPGNVTIQWLGYDIQTSVFIGAILLVAFIIGVILLGWLILLVWGAPRRLLRRLEDRRRRIGMDALRRGIFAAGAGDSIGAARAAAIAKKMVPEESLSLLLQAQSAQLIGDGIAARQVFERMLGKPEMSALGLRGLFIEARRAGELEAAKQFVERALAAHPATPWPSTALLELQAQEGDWRGALRTLTLARQYKHLDRDEANRRRSIALTALARELEDINPVQALEYATEAHNLAPALIPAAAIAGRLLAAQGHAQRAAKILGQTWKQNPHPELALIYAHARPGDSPRDRLARVKSLAASGPQGAEADLAIATTAVEAKDWEAARAALQPRLAGQPTARACILMARIEAGQNRDKGRAREWLARAARAAPDPVWVAKDGSASREWLPLSPGGALGSYEWRTPATAMPLGDGDELWAEIAAPREETVEARDITGLASESQTPEPEPEPAKKAEAVPLEAEIIPAAAGHRSLSASTAQAAVADAPAFAPLPPVPDVELPALMEVRAEAPEDRISDDADVAAAVPHSSSEGRSLAIPEGGGQSERSKPRQPTIFIPGRAPDDPGPRDADADDASTPLTRFRHPH